MRKLHDPYFALCTLHFSFRIAVPSHASPLCQRPSPEESATRGGLPGSLSFPRVRLRMARTRGARSGGPDYLVCEPEHRARDAALVLVPDLRVPARQRRSHLGEHAVPLGLWWERGGGRRME